MEFILARGEGAATIGEVSLRDNAISTAH
jgi:hypothetical protein